MTEWHSNDSHHGKAPMNGIESAIKDLVFWQLKSGVLASVIICYWSGDWFVLSIYTLFQ